MLTDVPEINQNQFMDVLRYTIDNASNTIVLGPSGGGKTEMCFSIIKEKKCQGIYINMAVLERTDFQGMPVISADKLSVNYATPEFLPFADVKLRSKKDALNMVLSWVRKQTPTKDIGMKKEEALSLLQQELANIEDIEEIEQLKKATNYLSISAFDGLKENFNSVKPEQENDVPIVIIFDEVDKAITEVLQTLLEFLQFRAINGRKLNIRSCFLTCNLPDEHAHTNELSHAITKRCLTFKLHIDFDIWKAWAVKNQISPLIIGFLTQNSNYLHKGPPDGDTTAYALPSPRTWTEANKVVKYFESERHANSSALLEDLRIKLLSGAVGETAAVQFNTWLNHYHTLDPFINDLMEHGTYPTTTRPDMLTSDIFICALSACAKLEAALKPENRPQIEKYVKNAFNWFETLQSDVQIGAIRMVFGGNFDNSKGHEGIIQKHDLAKIPEFVKVFISIKKNLDEWDKLNAARSEKLITEQSK
jgi:hypothetical protein